MPPASMTRVGFFFLITKEILVNSVYIFLWKENREEYCYCGYLLVIVTSPETQSVRSINLARASHTYAFICHFVCVAIELDAHIRSSHFIVSLPLVDHQKDRNINIHRLLCIQTEIHEISDKSIFVFSESDINHLNIWWKFF